MARKKTPKTRVNVKASLSRRLRDLRQELFGEHGGPELARRLNLPARTWYNYETGVTVPAEVLLAFIDQIGASPHWLFTGEGPKYNQNPGDTRLAELSAIDLIRRGLEKLEQAPHEAVAPREHMPGDATSSDFASVPLVSLNALGRGADSAPHEGYVMTYRQWLPNPAETVGVRLEDDAMHPILPAGSIVAIDRSVTDPHLLKGRIVSARPERQTIIRWLEISERHLILRANQQNKDFPLIPIELESVGEGLILGQVVWSWSRFGGS